MKKASLLRKFFYMLEANFHQIFDMMVLVKTGEINRQLLKNHHSADRFWH